MHLKKDNQLPDDPIKNARLKDKICVPFNYFLCKGNKFSKRGSIFLNRCLKLVLRMKETDYTSNKEPPQSIKLPTMKYNQCSGRANRQRKKSFNGYKTASKLLLGKRHATRQSIIIVSKQTRASCKLYLIFQKREKKRTVFD